MDALDESGHPEVLHGVLEGGAADVAVELLGVLLHPGPPVVLDLVVRPARQVLRDLRPPASRSPLANHPREGDREEDDDVDVSTTKKRANPELVHAPSVFRTHPGVTWPWWVKVTCVESGTSVS